jgi:hypothetical protein
MLAWPVAMQQLFRAVASGKPAPQRLCEGFGLIKLPNAQASFMMSLRRIS